MNYKDIALRAEFLQFIKIGEMEGYKIEGVGVSDASIELSPNEVTNQWVTMRSSDTTVRSYQGTLPIEKTIYKDDPLFKEIFKLFRTRAVGAKATGKLIDAYAFEGVGEFPTTCPADEWNISIAFNGFGGGEDMSINYTINYNGDPKPGTATIDYEEFSATFAPTVTP